jgi:hypothetical protein
VDRGTHALVKDLHRRMLHIKRTSDVIPSLILAGAMESSLEDQNNVHALEVRALTDALACLALGLSEERGRVAIEALKELSTLSLPPRLSTPRFEGFSYYALHPNAFADVRVLPNRPAVCAVIGIRSIGTVLSAMFQAAALEHGIPSSRLTIRPTGHPYDRVCDFTDSQREWVEAQKLLRATFIIVDEGPGLSGSSFLSVAEALVRTGIPSARIVLLGTREYGEGVLCAPKADQRWSKFQYKATHAPQNAIPADMHALLPGEWRTIWCSNQTRWPAVWRSMERSKFLTQDKKHILKFEGLGRFGEETLCRSRAIASAGFGPKAEAAVDGWVYYEIAPGCAATNAEVSTADLERIADYCSFRASEFATRVQDSDSLEQMLQFNALQECGIVLPECSEALNSSHATIVDGRMQPCEWIGSFGNLTKVDGASHGDDHFYPGPADIAWDLAGALVEWNLDSDAAAFLLNRFEKKSGRPIRSKLAVYLMAYSAFRMGYTKMAAATLRNTADGQRCQMEYRWYRRVLRRAGHRYVEQ